MHTFLETFFLQQAAGVTGPTSDVSVSLAQEALEQFQNRVATLERELQDLQYKVYVYSILLLV